MFTKKKRKNRTQSRQRKTIDTTHKNHIKKFDSLSEKDSQLEKKYSKLLLEKETLSQLKRCDMSDTELDRFFEINQLLEEYTKELKTNTESKNDYFLKTGHILFDYYSQKDKSSTTQDAQISENKDGRESKTVMDFFTNNNENETEYKPEMDNKGRQGDRKTQSGLGDIMKAYMKEIDDDSLIQKPIFNEYIEYCKKCHNHKIFIETESILLCDKCGEQENVLMNQNKPSYKDPPREYTFFTYKRINHFNEWLSQFQAKESTHIPDKIIDDLKNEIRKERIYDISKINPSRIRRFLKKLGYNKYYEHIPHIISKLNGVPPPEISPQTEEKLRSMFKMIQVPFLHHCPPKRKNFLSYAYVLHKFVQLLEMPELMCCFPLLKSRQKLYQQDLIWKKMCIDLDWTFIKSL